MITIQIAEDEIKVKEALDKLLRQEGFALSEDLTRDNVIRVVKVKSTNELAFIKDRITGLGDALFNDKKGTLYKSVVEAIEKPLIEYTLERTEGNQLKAARILGINRNTIRSKIKKLGINVDKWKNNG